MNQPVSFQSLRSKALAMLTRREHSAYELRQKLLEQGASESEILLILTEFKEKNWQNDERFCQAFIRHHAQKGHGEVVIKQELKQRGIVNSDFITTELEEYDWFLLAQETRSKNQSYSSNSVVIKSLLTIPRCLSSCLITTSP